MSFDKCCGIYKITEIETGQCYIGQSKNIQNRWKRHRRRFPVDKFTYEVLLTCDAQYLDFFEKAFICGYDSHLNGFNRTIGGDNVKSLTITEETRRKLSEAAKKNTNAHFKPGNKARIGRPHTQETKQKMSDSGKGRIVTEETRRKLSEAAKLREQRKKDVVR